MEVGDDSIRIARQVAGQFAIAGAITQISPLGDGLIHRTYRVRCNTGDPTDHPSASCDYVLQRINTSVFRDPTTLMQNVARIVSHLQAHSSTHPPSTAFLPDTIAKGVRLSRGLRPSLVLIPCRSDATQFVFGAPERTGTGVWRMYRFIANAVCCETPTSPEQAFQAAAAIGDFQVVMASLPPPALQETISGFHDTPARFDALEAAIARNAVGRVALVTSDIGYLRSHRAAASQLVEMGRRAELPTRTVHNDAKMSNVLLSRDTGEWLCVIDLDTVMPGLAGYDFGDLIRSMGSAAREDEPDISRVSLRIEYCEAITRGYLSTAAAMLTSTERETLIDGAIAITLEQAARFLSDFLDGDAYYATTRPDQNLDRTRTQLALARQLIEHAPRLRRLCH